MYRWAAAQAKLILVAGHTHRPVWSSRTHLQMLEAELAAAKGHPMAEGPLGIFKSVDGGVTWTTCIASSSSKSAVDT